MFKKYRILRGYTQEQLAELCNVDTTTIQAIERNRRIPSVKTLSKLIILLKISNKDLKEYFLLMTK